MLQTPGPYEAIVLADSIADGSRLTTLCCTFPRFVLAEFNTHRMFSRNSASSRAIPVKRRIASILSNPVVPLSFGKNKRGMQASDQEVADIQDAGEVWESAVGEACARAGALSNIGVHKQWANRICETYAWHTVIVTATEWLNYDALRISPHAQPEICKVSEAMLAARQASTPVELKPGDWHLPLVDLVDLSVQERSHAKDLSLTQLAIKLSVSRCAAVSFNRHLDHDLANDLARYGKLAEAGHMSPFEHAAQCGWRSTAPYHDYGAPFSPRYTLLDDAQREPHGLYDEGEWQEDGYFCGNFRAPWIQHRKYLSGEAVFG